MRLSRIPAMARSCSRGNTWIIMPIALLIVRSSLWRAPHILPYYGNLDGTTYHSHQGLTYGGLILADNTGGVLVMQCFELLLQTLKTTYGATNLIYHTIPSMYHRYPCGEDLYALFRNNATLVERKMSSTLPGERLFLSRRSVKEAWLRRRERDCRLPKRKSMRLSGQSLQRTSSPDIRRLRCTLSQRFCCFTNFFRKRSDWWAFLKIRF